MKFQFEITDSTVDAPPMAFSNEETRSTTLDYILTEFGVSIDELQQIVFTSVDDSGKMKIEKALQYGKDVTRYARFA